MTHIQRVLAQLRMAEETDDDPAYYRLVAVIRRSGNVEGNGSRLEWVDPEAADELVDEPDRVLELLRKCVRMDLGSDGTPVVALEIHPTSRNADAVDIRDGHEKTSRFPESVRKHVLDVANGVEHTVIACPECDTGSCSWYPQSKIFKCPNCYLSFPKSEAVERPPKFYKRKPRASGGLSPLGKAALEWEEGES